MERLKPGDVCQYRKVGQARLVRNVMIENGHVPRENGAGWWTVEWIKAPKKYREYGHGESWWFNPHDRI